ncbi:MAG TPA: hypothetical protein VIT23_09885 [Terrimicrobiaceae bacterium]
MMEKIVVQAGRSPKVVNVMEEFRLPFCSANADREAIQASRFYALRPSRKWKEIRARSAVMVRISRNLTRLQAALASGLFDAD